MKDRDATLRNTRQSMGILERLRKGILDAQDVQKAKGSINPGTPEARDSVLEEIKTLRPGHAKISMFIR